MNAQSDLKRQSKENWRKLNPKGNKDPLLEKYINIICYRLEREEIPTEKDQMMQKDAQMQNEIRTTKTTGT